jgi:hypothetical protein
MRACVCGEVNCKRHGRRTPKQSTSVVYGADHQERRRRMLADIAAGRLPAICQRCGQGPKPGVEWQWEAGHVQDVVLGGGPEVRPEHRYCNRKAGAQTGAKIRKLKAEMVAQRRMAETYRYLEEAR